MDHSKWISTIFNISVIHHMNAPYQITTHMFIKAINSELSNTITMSVQSETNEQRSKPFNPLSLFESQQVCVQEKRTFPLQFTSNSCLFPHQEAINRNFKLQTFRIASKFVLKKEQSHVKEFHWNCIEISRLLSTVSVVNHRRIKGERRWTMISFSSRF